MKSLADLDGKKLGTAKGTTSEQNASKALPKATILSFDDYPQAFLALQQGKVVAVTTDESILAGILGKAPNKDQYEIADIRISDEPYGLAIRKDNPKFLKFINDTLLEMEKNGEAKKIWDKWFNPQVRPADAPRQIQDHGGPEVAFVRSGLSGFSQHMQPFVPAGPAGTDGSFFVPPLAEMRGLIQCSGGSEGMFQYQFDWSVVLTGQYAQWIVDGIKVTIQLSVASIALSFLMGLLIAVMRMSQVGAHPRGLPTAIWSSSGTRRCSSSSSSGTSAPTRSCPQAVNDWLNARDFEFAAAVIALTIYTSAFIAEDIRSGIRSIPKEQMEAARSSGFSYIRSMQHIILPQAVRLTIPPLISQFLNLTKNSSLAMTIGVAELTYQARQVESYTFRGFEAFTAATLVYLVMSLVITGLVMLYDRKVLSPTGMK